MFQVMPGAQSALMNPLAAHLATNQLVDERVAQMILNNDQYAQEYVRRARLDPAVIGGVTGVPAMQQPTSYSPDIQYGTRLPNALVKTFMTDTPILDRIFSFGTTTRPERAAVYGLFSAMDFSAGEYGDFTVGSDPPGIQGTKSFAAEVKKSYGAMASITDVDAIASGAEGYPTNYGGENVTDDRQLLLRYCSVKTMRALEYSVIKGNKTSRPTQFDGIETALTLDATLRPFVINRAGATTGTLAELNNLLLVMQSKGVTPTELWMHPIVKQALTDEYLGQSGRTINITQGNERMMLGQQVGGIVTSVGTLPIFTSHHFTLGGTSPNLSADIFIISSNKDGIPLIGFEWMVAPRMIEPLARVPGFYTSQVMGVWCHGVLFDRSGWWAQGRIRNVGVSFNTTTYAIQQMTKP